MDYNLLKIAYVSTCTTTGSVAPLTNQSLSYDNLVDLFNGVTSGSGIAVGPQKYIGITSQLGRDLYCKEARLYTNDPSAGYIEFSHKLKNGLVWSNVAPTWNSSGYYTYNFGQTIIGDFKAFYGNASATVTGTCYEIQLLNWDEAVDFGVDGQLPDTALELPYVYFRPTALPVYNNNPEAEYAVPRVFVDSTGYYEADRIVKVSADYDPVAGVSGTWVTIDDGYNIPEDYDWDLGTYSNTAKVADHVALTAGTTSGYWQSPVIRIDDPQCITLYAYGTQKSNNAKINYSWTSVNEILRVRVSDSTPVENALFAIWAKVNNNNAGYTKRLIAEYDGTQRCLAQQSTCENTYVYWTNSIPWNFGGIFAFKTRPAFRSTDSEVRGYYWPCKDAFTSWGNCYNVGNRSGTPCYTGWLYQTYPAFSVTPTYSLGLLSFMVSFIAVPGSSSLFWAVYANASSVSPGYAIRYSAVLLNGTIVVRQFHSALKPAAGYFSSTQVRNCDACSTMEETGGVWILFYDQVMKYTQNDLSDTFDIPNAGSYEKLCPVGNSSLKGFWAIGPTRVSFFEHVPGPTGVGGTLNRILDFASPTYAFMDVRSASVDSSNNLWICDRGTNKIKRINYATQTLDFDKYVAFSSAVIASPEGRFAYVYVHSDPGHSDQDAMYRIDIETSVASYLGSFTGIYTPYSECTHVHGRVVAAVDQDGTYFQPISTDPVWGTGPNATPWVEYPNANMGLPKGKYKQFRITLQRNNSSTTTPLLEKVRIPRPLLMDAIPHHDYRNVYIDTDIETGAIPGRYDINLLVLWPEV